MLNSISLTFLFPFNRKRNICTWKHDFRFIDMSVRLDQIILQCSKTLKTSTLYKTNLLLPHGTYTVGTLLIVHSLAPKATGTYLDSLRPTASVGGHLWRVLHKQTPYLVVTQAIPYATCQNSTPSHLMGSRRFSSPRSGCSQKEKT